MKDELKAYMERLEASIVDYMQKPVNPTSTNAVTSMVECWEHLKEMSKCCTGNFTEEEAKAWNAAMVNDDGSTGGYWTVEQTTDVANSIGLEFDHITPYCWNVTMNMMYSDYCTVAERYGISTADFYADMSKAFLFDKDGGEPKEKLAAYYWHIVEPHFGV